MKLINSIKTKMKKQVNLNIRLEEELMKGFNETIDLINNDPLHQPTNKSSLLRDAIIFLIKKYNKKYKCQKNN